MANRSSENEKELDVKLEWVPVQGPDGKPSSIVMTTSGCERPGQSLRSIGGYCPGKSELSSVKAETFMRDFKRTSVADTAATSKYEKSSTRS